MSELRPVRRVALLPWGDLFDDDFLNGLGLSLESYCESFRGSWMIGWIEALRTAGVETVTIWYSARVQAPKRLTHRPTQSCVVVLPARRLYTALRRRMADPLGSTPADMFGERRGGSRVLAAQIHPWVPYLTTPLVPLGAELRRQRVDALMCQQYDMPRFDLSVLLGRFLGMPVFAVHQGGGERPLSAIEERTRRVALRRCAGLIVAAGDEARRIQLRYGVSPASIARIFNVCSLASPPLTSRTETRRQLGIPEAARVAVWHGRVEIQQKGLDVLVSAWHQLCATERQDDRLLLVGTGSGSRQLADMLRAHGGERVVWIDRFVQDPSVLQSYLQAGDVYVFPSRAEGFPVSPLEAMAAGLPVVATEASGIPDIFTRGEADGGVIVRGLSSELLTRELHRLLSQPALSARLGAAARQRSEAFSPSHIGRQLAAFLSDPAGPESRSLLYSENEFASADFLVTDPLRLMALYPSEARARQPFNVQLHGHAAMGIAAEHATRSTIVSIGETLLPVTYVSPTSLSVLIPRHLYRRPNRYEVFLTDGRRESNRLALHVA
jgi:glycosyltransferase involved in cell wall biosynthesis